jgi:muramoyltetrapeptide carboxypeptidase
MFYQLAHAGVLRRQAAILLGEFQPVISMPNDNGFELATVIERVRQIAGVPVLSGLPFGHSPGKLTLPVGGRARLVVRRGGAAALELSGYPNLG